MGPLKKGDRVITSSNHMEPNVKGTVSNVGSKYLNMKCDDGNGLIYTEIDSVRRLNEEHIISGLEEAIDGTIFKEAECSICGGSGTVYDDRNKPLSCGACSFEIAGSDGYWNTSLFNMKAQPNYRGTIKESYFIEAADGSVSIRGGLPEEVEASALERYISAHRPVDEVQDLDSFNMSELTEGHRRTAHEAKRASGVAKMAKVPSICRGQYKYSMFNKPADLPDLIGEVSAKHMSATQDQIVYDSARLRMNRHTGR